MWYYVSLVAIRGRKGLIWTWHPIMYITAHSVFRILHVIHAIHVIHVRNPYYVLRNTDHGNPPAVLVSAQFMRVSSRAEGGRNMDKRISR